MTEIAVLGAGAWGTALATAARAAGKDVVLWARRPALAAAINRDHENRDRLPGVRLDPAIRATSSLADLGHPEAVLLVTPAQALRELAHGLRSCWPKGAVAVICSKGIERGSGALMSDVLESELPGVERAVLSGPNFAMEIARGLPAAVTLACADEETGKHLVATLGSRYFRPYLSQDLVGAQIGGAAKNVIAIACGIVAGRGLGENARAGLITRGLAEIARLSLALGGRLETVMGLSGLGDLTLTCTAMQSRNYSLGVALGNGETLEALLSRRSSIAEGVFSAEAIMTLARRHNVDMPITAAVDAVLNHQAPLDATIGGLLARPFRGEAADGQVLAP